MTRRFADFSKPHRHCTIGDVMAVVIAALALTIICGCAFMLIVSSTRPAHARDLGQWEVTRPEIAKWFRGLMQPDNPGIPCCGEADAYWAESFEMKNGEYVAIVTDEEQTNRYTVRIST